MIQDSIRQLAANSPNQNSFYQQFLPLVASRTNALGGIAWNCNADPFTPICQTRSKNHENLNIGLTESKHISLLQKAVNESGPNSMSMLIQQDNSIDFPGTRNESPVIVLSVVRREESIELVEMFYPNGLDPSAYQNTAKSLDFFCRTASQCDLNPDAQEYQSPQTSGPAKISAVQLDEYVHQIHRSIDSKVAAKQIANEARRVLDCDRVTVVDRRGGRCRATAVSGQPSVNNRSNAIYLLRKLVSRVLPTKQTFWYPTDKPIPREIDKPLQAYLEQASTRSLVVVPIFEEPPVLQENPDAPKQKKNVIGGMIIEHCVEQWERSHMESAVETVSRHASDSYRNAFAHGQLLFYPLWKWLGKSKVIWAARNLPKTLLALVGLIGLGLMMFLFPADLKISCDGVLVPEVRQNVFVPLDGTVSKVAIEHGTEVKAGDTLLVLTNNDLENQASELNGRIVELKSRIEDTETMLLSPNNQELGEQNLNAQKAQLKSLESQLALLNRKLEKLKIVSPIDGQVVTWNIEERLRQRPVSRGEQILEIANANGKWELELDVADRSVGHIQDALTKNEGKPLDVEFIVAADPDRKFKGKLIEIGKATQVKSDSGPTVSLRIEIEDQDKLDIKQIKSSVSANVICKETTLGHSMFHGVSEFVQRQWFKLF